MAHLCFIKGITESLLRFPRHSRDNGGRGDADKRDTKFLAVSTFVVQGHIDEGNDPPLQ